MKLTNPSTPRSLTSTTWMNQGTGTVGASGGGSGNGYRTPDGTDEYRTPDGSDNYTTP